MGPRCGHPIQAIQDREEAMSEESSVRLGVTEDDLAAHRDDVWSCFVRTDHPRDPVSRYDRIGIGARDDLSVRCREAAGQGPAIAGRWLLDDANPTCACQGGG